MKKKILLINTMFALLIPFMAVKANKKLLDQTSHQIQLIEIENEAITDDEDVSEEDPFAPLNDSRTSIEILADEERSIIEYYEKKYGPNQAEWPKDVRDAMFAELLEIRM